MIGTKPVITPSLLIGMYSIEDFFTSKIGTVSHSYECEIPYDIPDTLAGGQKIDWDCNWYAAYKDGDVFVLYYDNDTTKGAKAIVMNSSYWFKIKTMEDFSFDGLTLCCPECNWAPRMEIFFHISLSVHLNNKKLPMVHCRFMGCTYKGTLLDWVHFTVEF